MTMWNGERFPRCGAPLDDDRKCRRIVREPFDRCHLHPWTIVHVRPASAGGLEVVFRVLGGARISVDTDGAHPAVRLVLDERAALDLVQETLRAVEVAYLVDAEIVDDGGS